MDQITLNWSEVGIVLSGLAFAFVLGYWVGRREGMIIERERIIGEGYARTRTQRKPWRKR